MGIHSRAWVGTPFCRYSATGNTFLTFDNRSGGLESYSASIYKSWCQKYNVDGLLFVEKPRKSYLDFHMRYLNADGGEVEMCGNGARTIIHFFCKELRVPAKGEGYVFSTQRSEYLGQCKELFPIQMTELRDWGEIEVSDLLQGCTYSDYLNTGVPHALFEVKDLESFAVNEIGAKVRNDRRFPGGVNANFFKVLKEGELVLRTYERGVEGETLSCGTGATAVALSLAKRRGWTSPIIVRVGGGELTVSFNYNFSRTFLAGAVDLLERNRLTP